MSDQRDFFFLKARQIVVPPGGSLAVALGMTHYVMGHIIGRYTGGSSGVYLHSGISYSDTTAPGTGFYIASTNAQFEIAGPAKFYLAAVGSTATVEVIEKISQGAFGNNTW